MLHETCYEANVSRVPYFISNLGNEIYCNIDFYSTCNNCWQFFQDPNCSSLFFCYMLPKTSWYFVWKTKFPEFPWKHCQGIIRRDASPRNIKKLSDYEECQDMQIAVFLNRTFWWANMWNIDAIPLIYILLIYYILYISERKFRILEIVLDLLVVYGSSVTSNYLS